MFDQCMQDTGSTHTHIHVAHAYDPQDNCCRGKHKDNDKDNASQDRDINQKCFDIMCDACGQYVHQALNCNCCSHHLNVQNYLWQPDDDKTCHLIAKHATEQQCKCSSKNTCCYICHLTAGTTDEVATTTLHHISAALGSLMMIIPVMVKNHHSMPGLMSSDGYLGQIILVLLFLTQILIEMSLSYLIISILKIVSTFLLLIPLPIYTLLLILLLTLHMILNLVFSLYGWSYFYFCIWMIQDPGFNMSITTINNTFLILLSFVILKP